MKKITAFSQCRKYRYTLWRNWKNLYTSEGYVMFIGLNPSTADEVKNDPTIRRCIAYAKKCGYEELCMTNLFAFRSTSPSILKTILDPIGPDNNQMLYDVATGASIIVAAWGRHGKHLGRDKEIQIMFPKLYYLRLTKDGIPKHPLYLPKNLEPTLWNKR